MVKKKSSFQKAFSKLLNHNGLKVTLGLVATSSFAIAFGEEKISQLASLTGVTDTQCLSQFYQKVPPYLSKESLQKNTYPLCMNGFNVMYSGVSKTPLWVAEALTPHRLSQKIPREDSFHEETRIPIEHRAILTDYKRSGFDRGHMAPNADMPNKVAQYDSFSLVNMVPQSPKNNQQVWRELEEATRAIVTKQKHDVYVITGPTYTGKKLKTIGTNKVIVPTALYKAIYIPKTGAIGAYYAPNDDSLSVKVVSVCYLEEQLGINLFPQLTEEQKRNTYQLPLSAAVVKANKPLSYSHWDAESQCAEDVALTNIETLQKQFKADNSLKAADSIPTVDTSKTQTDDNNLESLIKQLLLSLLQSLVHFFR